MVAIWYVYREESLLCATQAKANIVRFLREDREVAFDISTNDPRYRGVRGNGTTSMTTDDDKAVLRELLESYLGGTDSELAEWLLKDDREEVRIRVQPREIYSWDYTERMGTPSRGGE